MKRESTTKMRVILVEDHPMFREQVAQVINRDLGMMVCGEAETMVDAIDTIRETKPGIAIVDLTLRGSSGVQLIKTLGARGIWLPVIVLTMVDEETHAERLHWAGARGFVSKSATSTELMKAIRKVLAGGIYLSEALMALALQKMASPQAKPPGGMSSLSVRELEFFRLLGLNYTTREISEMMGCSLSTVNSFRSHVRTKLSVKSTVELYKLASNWVEQQSSV